MSGSSDGSRYTRPDRVRYIARLPVAVVLLYVGGGTDGKRKKASWKSEDGGAVSLEAGALVALPRARQQRTTRSSTSHGLGAERE